MSWLCDISGFLTIDYVNPSSVGRPVEVRNHRVADVHAVRNHGGGDETAALTIIVATPADQVIPHAIIAYCALFLRRCK